jgi:DnaK suppressor protein
MDPETIQQYRERLLDQQQQIAQRIFRLETDLHEMESEKEIERTDHIQEEAVNDTMIELDERSRRLSEEIQAALVRLDDGTYGICEVCAEPINAARLAALLTARRCVACQEEAEQAASAPPGAGAPHTARGGL